MPEEVTLSMMRVAPSMASKISSTYWIEEGILNPGSFGCSLSRSNFLRNSVTSDDNGSDFNLELDCYNEKLKIACEYNGAQHYKFIPYFHKNKDAFQNQKYRDYMKRDLCLKNNITLIEVPYNIKHEHIENYIINKLIKAGYKV